MNAKTLCLGILSFGDATGYEIKKMVENGMFNHFIEASFGSIYPALTRMSEEGLVTCREEMQSGKPDKKVYSITAKGRSELIAALSTTPKEDKFKSEFLFVMLLSNLLPQTHVASVYEQRIQDLRDELDEMRTCSHEDLPSGGHFVVGYGMAIFEAAIDYMERNRDNFAQTTSGDMQRSRHAADAAE